MPDSAARILVVEDDPFVRAMLCELLQSDGYTVEYAADGPSGLARIEAGGVDLVLLALLLPGLGGLDLCQRVRAREGDVYLPILMLTALSDEAQRQAGFAAGADDYIVKPFETAELLDRVRVWTRARRRLKACHGALVQAYGRLAALDRQREEFLALVSHELRQPMAAIATMADALAEAPGLSAREQRALGSLCAQARGLGQLAEDLLNIARLEAGFFRLQTSEADLGALVANRVRQSAEPTRVRVMPPPFPVRIVADLDRLGQALDNLLRNALKYSPTERPVWVTVSGTTTEACITVHDEGVGLAPDELPRLFQKYGRGRHPATRAIEGVGLGLYLTRLLVESHGGRVVAESPGPGRGATFRIILPRVPGQHEGSKNGRAACGRDAGSAGPWPSRVAS